MIDAFEGAGLWWLGAAALLAITELFVPGVFLVFLALAAAITGVFTLLFPDLPLAGQAGSFAAWSVLAVLIGRRWYADTLVDSTDPLLNDRSARLLGQTVTVVAALDGGEGRVRVGDGEWPARGPALPVGARARVIGVQGTCLTIEPLPPE